MAFQIYIEANLCCVFVEFSGILVRGEPRKAVLEAIDAPGYIQGFNLLTDHSKARFPDDAGYHYFGHETPERLAVDARLGRCKKALVAGSEIEFGLLRQVSQIDEIAIEISPRVEVERQVFRDVGTARRWLGIPDEYVIDYRRAATS